MTMTRLTAVVAVLALGACGGDGGRAAGSFTTSVPGNKMLNGLTPAEVTTLCMDITSFAADAEIRKGSCKISGFLAAFTASLGSNLSDAELKVACMEGYSACLAAPDEPGMCAAPSASCTATVAELSACLKDSRVALAQIHAATPDCSAITRAVLEDDSGGGTPPPDTTPACMTFETKCPDGIPD